MIKALLIGLGIAAIIEGLVLALAPLRFDELMRVLASMTPQQRRLSGLLVATVGLIILWVVQILFPA